MSVIAGNLTEPNLQQYTILIVDDNPTNLGVIFDYLKDCGFKTLVATDGELALKRAEYIRPDLILLDVIMPGMDGFETCQQLKANEATKDIPVIFMTALVSTEDKVKGFEVGAVDYVTKPLQHEEVLARVTTHLRLRELTLSLREQNVRLQKVMAHLERRTTQLQVAAEVARDATAARQLDELLNRAVNLIQDRFGFYHAAIFLVDERGEYAVLRAASGEAGRKLLEQEFKLKVGEVGIVGYVTGTGQPYIASQVDSDPAYFREPLLPETRSEMGLPLRVGDQVIGALDVQSHEKDAFDEDDVQVLQTMADQLAVALEKMRLFEQTQAALEERLQTVVSNAPVVLFALDREGVFTLAEGKGLESLGFKPDELVGGSAFDLWREKPGVMEDTRRALAGEAFASVVEMGKLVFEARWSPLRDRKGDVAGVTIVATDVTERARAEEELRKYRDHLEELVTDRTRELEEKATELGEANLHLQEADRLKSVFLASMSHELRTPLNSIIGFTGILLQGMVGEINEEQRKQLTLVKNSANHLLNLIMDVLDIAEIEAGRVEPSPEEFELDDVIREVVESFSPAVSEKGLELTRDVPEGIMVFSDRKRVKQVLMNFVSNAVKFTDQGSIRVAVRISEGEEVEMKVTDTGPGIKEEDMNRLFQPFQQVDVLSLTKSHEGTGLGLYLTRKLAVLLGGDVWAKSEFGKGSEFTFTIPLKL